MRIASEIAADGAVVGVSFSEGLRAIIKETKPKFIVETGTYLGTGSTRVITEAMGDAEFWSIECNPAHHKQAKRNISHPNLSLMLGISVPGKLLPAAVNFTEYPDNVVVDHQPSEREALYLAEVNYDVPDDMLGKAIKYQKPDLVLLDSAGHMGTIEFDYLMTKMKKSFILALDDTGHVKHHKTLEKILNDKRWTILFSTEDKFGGCIAKFTPSRNRKSPSKNTGVSK